MATNSTCWVENINEKLFQLVFRKSVNRVSTTFSILLRNSQRLNILLRQGKICEENSLFKTMSIVQ